VSASDIELFALDGGRTERPYSAGDADDRPIRLKTSARMTAETLAPFKHVPVRSVWLMGRGHTDHDVALVAATFGQLADLYVPFSSKLTDASIRALVPVGEHFRSFGVLRSRISDEGAKILATFPELRVARLEHSQLTDVGVAALGECRKLEVLHLDGGRAINGGGLSAFVDHPALRALFLRGTQVDDDAIGHLSGCAELKDLWLSATRVSERCLLTLPRNPDLSVGLPLGLDPERIDAIRSELNFVVDGVGPSHVIDVPRNYEGKVVDLPLQLRGNSPTLVMFTSLSCPPCKRLKTTYDLVRPNLRERFKYVELDVEENLDLASAMRVRSVPTVLVLQFGIELHRSVGAVGIEKLTEYLEAALDA
jgi:thioredoxin 1